MQGCSNCQTCGRTSGEGAALNRFTDAEKHFTYHGNLFLVRVPTAAVMYVELGHALSKAGLHIPEMPQG